MRVLVFGDSISYGKVDTEGGWVSRVRKHFDIESAKNYSRDVPNVYNQGISGDTAEDILQRFDVETKARVEDEVAFILAVGTNDSSVEDGAPRYTTQEFRANIEAIINKMRQHSIKILLVGLLPVNEELTTPIPWRPKRHYTNKQILLFDGVIRELAKAKRLPYLSLFEDFKDRLELFPDGLHPNDEGHKLMADLIQPELDKLLQQ